MATLDELVVRIRADVSQLERALKGTERSVAATESRTRRLFRRLDSGISRVSRSVFSLRGAIVGVGAALAFRGVLSNTIRQERALTQIEAALRATGSAAGLTAEELAEMASGFQSATTFGDEFVLEVSRQLLSFRNITEDVFEDTLAVILDFATATGRDASQAARTLGLAINDPLAGLGRLSQAGVALTKSQKDLIKELTESGDLLGAQRLLITELEAAYGGAAVAARKTLGGALTALGNAFGDLFENAEATEDLTESIESLTQTLSSPEFKAGAQAMTEFLFGVVNFATDAASALGEFVGQIDALIAAADLIAEPEPINLETAGLEEVEQQVGAINQRVAFLRTQLENLSGAGAGRGRRAAIEEEINRLLESRAVTLARLNELRAAEPSLPAPMASLDEPEIEVEIKPIIDPDDLKNITDALSFEARSLELQIDFKGADTEAARIAQRLLEIEALLGGSIPPEVVALVGDVERLRTKFDEVSLSEELKADLIAARESIQAEIDTLRIRLRFQGQESEEMRVQLRLAELRRDLEGEIPPQIEAQVRAAEAMRTKLDEIVETQQEGINATNEFNEAVNQLGFSFSSAFEDAIIDGENLGTVLKSLEEDITRIFFRKLVTEPIFGGIAAGLQNALPGPGLGEIISGGIGSIFGTGGESTASPVPTTVGGGGTVPLEQAGGALAGVFEQLGTVGGSAAAALEGTGTGATEAGTSLGTNLVGSVLQTVGAKAAETATSQTAGAALASLTGSATAAAAALQALAAATAASAATSTATSAFSGFTVGGARAGGLVQAFAEGGMPAPVFGPGGIVRGPGTGTSDSILARISAGEFIVNAAETRKHRGLLDQINAGKVPAFAEGGMVGFRVPEIRVPRFQRGGEVTGQNSKEGTLTINFAIGGGGPGQAPQPGGQTGGFLGSGMTRQQTIGQIVDLLDEANRKGL